MRYSIVHRKAPHVANTNEIRTKLHPYVRDWLRGKYGIAFAKSKVSLQGCTGSHVFDAVSADAKIVAEIKAASGRTSGDKSPAGKRASAFEQLYYLSLVAAETKLLVLTDPEFFNIIKKKSSGKVPGNIQLVYCPLPTELARAIKSVTRKASEEIDRGKKSFRKGAAD
jgi:hypothetical protein